MSQTFSKLHFPCLLFHFLFMKSIHHMRISLKVVICLSFNLLKAILRLTCKKTWNMKFHPFPYKTLTNSNFGTLHCISLHMFWSIYVETLYKYQNKNLEISFKGFISSFVAQNAWIFLHFSAKTSRIL